ncbi:hypothetical protein PUNSTDRAFT_146893 [Punctularia strigosozonata HHB-11173 SS5]|uniref:Uncharacterized protein n=1 Tax=Punctularia strigosozonata (strain HHB-11173) TaxID=741275 RepID=R7S0J3_PUNST|nr:uncharacterized protein PUNSTDRAFT_146893 [Punctularia strigosozonata HHB-11173 SS5]EIN03723.1 hypothetical protein PUNSTDRAFT_146893 [Punctularia strigosozonata HHB-11173 SS5]
MTSSPAAAPSPLARTPTTPNLAAPEPPSPTASTTSEVSLVRRAATRTRARSRGQTLSSPGRGRTGAPDNVPVVPARTPSASAKAESLAAFGELLDIVQRARAGHPPVRPERSPMRGAAQGYGQRPPSSAPVEDPDSPRGRAFALGSVSESSVVRIFFISVSSSHPPLRCVDTAAKRGVSLPRLPSRTGTRDGGSSSASSSIPSLPTPVHIIGPGPLRHARINSDETAQTGTSSSLYPLSSAFSRSGLASPTTIEEHELEHDRRLPAIADMGTKSVEGDVDDIAYRLQLLVKNSYFLPPAHAKPSPADFLPPTTTPTSAHPDTTKKSPGFLDLFRVGRGKSSKPGTPTGSPGIEQPPPVLRTTSDSSTASGHVPRPAPQAGKAVASTPIPPLPAPTRVVVVREKMDDLRLAAKQSERDLKARKDAQPPPAAAPSESNADPASSPGAFVDPTDVVDLPLPGPGYPFAVQTSALHGLGVGESVGAAVLAERLPPGTPGVWSTDESFRERQKQKADEGGWRKALLHEAVQLSLSGPDSSSASSHRRMKSSSSSSVPPSPGPSSRGPQSPSLASGSGHGHAVEKLDQRIIDLPRMDSIPEVPHAKPPATPPSPRHGYKEQKRDRAHLSPLQTQTLRSSLYAPQRSETPAGPSTPLAPPPRKGQGQGQGLLTLFSSPQHSHSQTDLSSGSPRGEADASRSSSQLSVGGQLRKTASTPLLSASSQERERGRRSWMDTPPLPRRTRTSPSPMPSHSDAFRTATNSVIYSETDASESDAPYVTAFNSEAALPGRPSVSVSLSPSEHDLPRPSLSMSEYSQPSPTVSAFRDAIPEGHAWDAPGAGGAAEALAQVAQDAARYYVVSPPPRTSSALDRVPTLSPAPRRRADTARTAPSPTTASASLSPYLTRRPNTADATPAAGSSHSLPNSSYHSLFPTSRAPSPVPTPIPEILAPEPATPPFPETPQTAPSSSASSSSMPRSIAARRSRPDLAAISLAPILAGRYESPAIHSAPPPASPADFFDSIEARPNALDELDTSSESEGEEDENAVADVGTGASSVAGGSVYGDARTRTISIASSSSRSRPQPSSFMRLGNHSSPHVSRVSFATASSGGGGSRASADAERERRRPVGNVPPKPTFFSRRKEQIAPAPAIVLQQQRQRQPAEAPFAETAPAQAQTRQSADSARSNRSKLAPSPSIRRLEGMLQQHMEAERTAIKRITTTHSTGSHQGHE